MKDTESFSSKDSGVAAVTYSFSNLSVVNVTADINAFRLISLDTTND